MKKIVSAILSAALVLSSAAAGITALAADDYSAATAKPLINAGSLSLGTQPKALTDSKVSTFSAYADYTVKSGKTASLLYDMSDTETAYSNDFNNGETLGVANGGGTVSNDNGELKLAGSDWLQTESIFEGRDFEMDIDVRGYHHWTDAMIYMRGEELALNLRGNGPGSSSGNFVVLTNRTTGEVLNYGTIAEGNHLKVKANGSKVEIFVGGESAIVYEYPANITPKSGSISFTINNAHVSYDNICIVAPKKNYSSEKDSYMQINLGETVSLSKRINGTEKVLASAQNVLKVGKTYAIRATREQGTVKVYADDKEILNTAADFPVTEGDISLWNGRIGVSATAEDSLENLKIFNSVNLKANDDFTELLPVQTGVSRNASITKQWSWTGDAELNGSINSNNDGSFIITSPSANNSFITVENLFDRELADVYLTFDIYSDRPDWTNEEFYFAGYTLKFGANGEAYAPQETAKNIKCADKYKYYCNDTHTIEFLKTGSTVSVWFYRKGEERTLLFTDSNCSAYTTNFAVQKFQGGINISNFKVYDKAPDGTVGIYGVNEYSVFTQENDGVGNVPEGTSVRELKANLNNPSQVLVSRDGKILADTDKVQNGDKIEYSGRILDWTVKTIAADEYALRSIMGDALFEHCKLVGRQYYVENEGVSFEWTASNITLGGKMKGNVTAIIDADKMPAQDYSETGINVVVDGDTANPKFIKLESGVKSYTVAENLSEGEHTLQIFKNAESIMSLFILKAIKFNGTPEKPADKTHKIEFLGDSITAGCGIKASEPGDWMHFSYNTYASRTARMLDADYYCISNSGWGFARNLKDPTTINRIYELTSDRRDGSLKWDFSWQPELVVINLGTNDNFGLQNIKNPDLSALKEKYDEYATELLTMVRKNNPKATIIWTYGAMGYGMDVGDGKQSGDWIKETVEKFAETDKNTYFYKMAASQNGGGSHPDLIGSKYLAEDLTAFICEKTGWTATGLPEKVTHTDGEVLKDYKFDTTTEGFECARENALSVANGKLHLDAADNKEILTSAVVGDRYLDTYEMTLDFKQLGSHDWNREIITLRSPNSSLSDAVYLAFLGNNIATKSNWLNPLKNEDNLQLISVRNGKIISSQSLKLDDLYDGKEKRIKVKMSKSRLEIMLYNVGGSIPDEPTFSLPLGGSVEEGDIFLQGHCTTFEVDNIKVIYKTDDIKRFDRADAPEIIFRSENSVSLRATEGCEYSIDGKNWQISNEFDNLTAKNTYKFYMRYAANADTLAGIKSEPLSVKLYLNGDINHNDGVDGEDLVLLRKHLLGAGEVSDKFAADANTDKIIDIRDLVAIKKLAAKSAE
mgnify:CR=1 FL=1